MRVGRLAAMAPSAAPLALAAVLACFTAGCPQLLEDDFSSSLDSDLPDASAGGSANVGGAAQAGAAGTGGGTEAGGGGEGGSSGTGSAAGGSTAAGCVLGPFSDPELLGGLDRTGALWGPSLSADGLLLAFSESVGGQPEDVFWSERPSRDAAFEAALPALGVNTADSEGTTFLARNGRALYFYSNRPGGSGGRDLYVATRAALDLDFGAVQRLEGINGADHDHMPWLSPDELAIYFTSARPGANESENIWYARRSSMADGFQPPVELPNVNSSSKDDSPALTADEKTLFFATERDGGPGNFDIWMATRDDIAEDFGAPEPVPVVNSALSEANLTVSSDGNELIFSSSRAGEERLFRSVRACE